VELPDDDKKMSKHVGVWIMFRDTVVIYTLVILNVHLLVIIKIKKKNYYNYLRL
jgi:hypothetical protein